MSSAFFRNRRWRRPVLALLALLFAGDAQAQVGAQAQDVAASGSDFGGMGLIEMRNARFREDGTLETGASIRHQRRFWFLNLQALPFLETTFRLTERLNATIGQGMTTDRAFDLKIRLMQENEWRPALAIGLQDLIGTGLYAGEYLVASKRWHDLDFTLGLGWGRLGTGGDLRNPLSLLRDGFDERPRDVGRGGTLQSGFFRGRDAAVFGGVEWRVPPVPTPWGELEGLIAKAEWSGDDLRDERGGYPAVTNGLRGRAASRLNAGLQWSNGWMDAGFHAVHGTDFLFRLSFRANPAHPPRLPRPALPVLAPRPAAPMEEAARAEKVFAALKAAGFHPIGFGIDGGEARIAFADGRERTLAGAANRVLRAVQPFLPRQVEMLRLSWWQSGGEVATLLLPRGSLEAIARHEGSLEEAYGDATLEAADGLLPKGMRAGPPLDLQWGLEPKVQLALGDPSRTLRWQGAVEAGLRIGLPEGFAIAGSVQRALIGNLADGPSSDSQLAHVRSDYGRYAREGETSIPALYGERLWNVAPDLFARASLGYLEPMFGGVSGEVLWRPHGERWALGADINWVQQRDFDQKLGFRGYRVATGHVSAYADLPWWNLYGVVRAGRYLAGDWGATIELGRRFDSGIEIGGFATFTDVPFSRFGEGSFDKGIYVRIPLEIFGSDTRSQGTAMIRPVVRDGGQRLSVDSPLWEVTRDGRQDAFQRGVSNFGRQ